MVKMKSEKCNKGKNAMATKLIKKGSGVNTLLLCCHMPFVF